MGQVNQPTNVLDQIRELRREVAALRKSSGLTSAHIDSGGLTLTNDAFIRMIDDAGFEILYFGPDGSGKQIIRIRREGGTLVFFTAFAGGQQYWRLVDRFDRELFSDDTINGGMGSPWFNHPLYPLFSMPASSVYGYMHLPVASVGVETTLWQGRLPLVTHPFMVVSGIWGQVTGSNSSTYNLRLGPSSTLVGSWSETALVDRNVGPFNCTAFLDVANVTARITVTAAGTGNIACQLFTLGQRQT